MLSFKFMTAVSVITTYLTVSRVPEHYYYFLGRPSYVLAFLQLFVLEIVAWLAWHILLYPKLFSPLRHLPGPKGNSFFMGQFATLSREKTGRPMKEWMRTIPNDGLIRYLDMFNMERVLVVSPVGLRELLVTKCYDFVKPKLLAGLLIDAFGAGMPFVEGDVHRLQKKTMMPAFAFRHIKELVPVFWDMGKKMLLCVTADIDRNLGKPRVTNGVQHPIQPDQAVVNAMRWFKRTTLDVMGVAGMGKDFEAMEKEDNPLVKAYHDMFQPGPAAGVIMILRAFLPGWLVAMIPSETNDVFEAGKATMIETCHKLITEKSEKLARKELEDLDLISMALQTGTYSMKDLTGQVTTFLLAGHESTSVALTWAIYGLAQHPDIQTKLREEVRSKLPSPAGSSTISSIDLDRVPYLYAVCNEILRYYDVFVWTWREADKDTTLLGQHIPKGTYVVVPFAAIHRDQSLWGTDADQFLPDRWLAEKSGALAKTGGADTNFAFMSFLQGPRSCIGESFARAEFACLLAAWVGRFEWELNDKREMDEANLVTAGGFTVAPIEHLDVRIKVVDGW